MGWKGKVRTTHLAAAMPAGPPPMMAMRLIWPGAMVEVGRTLLGSSSRSPMPIIKVETGRVVKLRSCSCGDESGRPMTQESSDYGLMKMVWRREDLYVVLQADYVLYSSQYRPRTWVIST